MWDSNHIPLEKPTSRQYNPLDHLRCLTEHRRYEYFADGNNRSVCLGKSLGIVPGKKVFGEGKIPSIANIFIAMWARSVTVKIVTSDHLTKVSFLSILLFFSKKSIILCMYVNLKIWSRWRISAEARTNIAPLYVIPSQYGLIFYN